MQPLAAAIEPPIKSLLRPWGIVIKCNPEGVKKLKSGQGGAAAIATAIRTGFAVSPDATYSKAIDVVAAVIAGYFATLAAVIGVIDEGKGVYITTTWIHYRIPGGTALPIVTPI